MRRLRGTIAWSARERRLNPTSLRPSSPLLLAVALLGGCVPADPAHPVLTRGWVDTRLYFGLGPADRPDQGVSPQAWRDFLDREVTPRYPAGLSVIDVYGQWQGAHDATPQRLRSKLLVIDHPDDARDRAAIEAIRDAWKRRTGDLSVLRVTLPAEVSF